MHSTGRTLRIMASIVATDGVHTGEQLAHRGATDRYDICALAWIVAEDRPAPDVFFHNQADAMDLLQASKPAMDVLRTLSTSIRDYEVPDTDGQPDVIEHVFNWTATPGIGKTKPPSRAEIVVRLLHASERATTNAA